MARRTATSPDGREWEVSVHRVRMPRWPESDYDPGDLIDPISWVVALVLAPVFWLVVPLVQVAAELPVAVGRSFFSRTRWVEARCGEPSELWMVWRTSRERAEEVADHVALRLRAGYEDLPPPGVTLESMTRPAGFDDLES
jgi:hypothetical protein